MFSKISLIATCTALYVSTAVAHERAVEFPDTEDGSVVLAADLHTHSVFSDGEVWPSIRVKEAHLDGLEVLAVTEHLEHQPHKADMPHPDRNRSYEIAEGVRADSEFDLMVINGAEVTRDMPYGHINAKAGHEGGEGPRGVCVLEPSELVAACVGWDCASQ